MFNVLSLKAYDSLQTIWIKIEESTRSYKFPYLYDIAS